MFPSRRGRWRRSVGAEWRWAAAQLAGLAVGLCLLYFLLQFPVTSRVLGQHIVYEFPHFYIGVVMALYLLATCVISMLATDRIIRWFGALSLATFLGAYAIHAATLVSVWCFFAALLSLIVYGYFRAQGNEGASHRPTWPLGGRILAGRQDSAPASRRPRREPMNDPSSHPVATAINPYRTPASPLGHGDPEVVMRPDEACATRPSIPSFQEQAV